MNPLETNFIFQNKNLAPYWPMVKSVMRDSGKVTEHEFKIITRMVAYYEELREKLSVNYICSFETKLWRLNETDPGGWSVWVKVREKKHQTTMFAAVLDMHRNGEDFFPKVVFEDDDLERSMSVSNALRVFESSTRSSTNGNRVHLNIVGEVRRLLQEMIVELSKTHTAFTDTREDGMLVICLRDREFKNSFAINTRSMPSVVLTDIINNDVLRSSFQSNESACIDYATGWVFH